MPCSTLRRHTTCVPARLRSALSALLFACGMARAPPPVVLGLGGLGCLTAGCARVWSAQLLSFATNNLPDGSGFGLGFYLGLRYI